MSYIVVYQRADGSSGLEECTSLDLAVVAAERLRNVDSVESPRILKTEEVKFDFRPYYRVEVAADDATERPTPLSAPASSRLSSSTSTSPSAPAPSSPANAGTVGTSSSSAATSSESATTPIPAASSGAFVSSAAIANSTPPPPAEDAIPQSPPVAESAPAVAPEPVETVAEDVAEADIAAAPIDPWATAEGSSIDYSLKSDTPDDAQMDHAVAEAETEQDLSSGARGLFSTNTLPDPPKDIDDAAALAEDVSDAVPPRRGLFGR